MDFAFGDENVVTGLAYNNFPTSGAELQTARTLYDIGHRFPITVMMPVGDVAGLGSGYARPEVIRLDGLLTNHPCRLSRSHDALVGPD